ncbi:hypothetical protein HanHA300_Chr09g0341931 [Helianthus annuus]|nr:hypothetical protein HanHA300_Chr09g0341931 [Helianthus annuus]KAJ0544573.1 hypothetical protein HanHA89_Chr09g0363161 [Helianthus annuus]KAJ0777954.1 hypothetical protein HanLR1_Chr02g0066381 [Helianthus annuus]KAJ0786965.1 hypothetical protein HanOQP8_Chr02g0077251 [Helianthus annuus]
MCDRDLGLDLAIVLDDFGSVIVLGDVVFRLNRLSFILTLISLIFMNYNC